MELLSPAGSPQSFKAALESGANAVYLGLPWFNARKPAMNFTPETLKESLIEAHSKNVKVYVTLNTDIKPSEIEDAAKVLTLLEELKVDAVIIKDFGLFYLAKTCFPSLELHLSTQFGISNSYAAEQAKKIGATRVIPARELSFDELTALQNSKMDIPEIEAFVQGSMCFSFSGKCLLSSWVGGKSANRGVCQAPCRLKYNSGSTEFPFFSMKDLNLASRLDDLKKANVTSLKIEGRLKSPGWVGSITSIYNSALNGEVNEEKTKESLLKYSGREMGEGFTTGVKNLTAVHRAKFGSFLGTVVDMYRKDGNDYAVLDIVKKSPETSLRFVSEEDEFLTIIHPEKIEIFLDSDEKWVIQTFGRVTKNSLIYEVIPARKSVSGIGNMKYDLELEVIGNNIEISVVTDSGTFKELELYKKIVKQKRGVYPDAVYDKLEKKSVNGWRLNKLYCEDILLSKTQVNSIVKIVSYILAVTIRESNPLNKVELRDDVKEFLSVLTSRNKKPNVDSKRVNFNNFENYAHKNIIVDEIEYNEKILNKIIDLSAKKDICISLFPISFEKDMEEMKQIVTFLENKCRLLYEINDIGHYNLLTNYLSIPSDRIVSGQGMACYNHLSIKFLKEVLGLGSVSIPMELDSRGVIKLVEDNNGSLNLRFTTLSTVPVMYSRVQSDEFVEGAKFVDKIGTEFHVHKFRDINIFVADDYFSAEGCRDLEGLTFNELISEQECLNNPGNTRKKFNLERRLY